MPKIVFVGAGPSTTAALYTLIEQGKSLKGLDITVIEKTPPFGPGVAYSTKEHCHLLNAYVTRMSINAENPNDFFAWLNDNQKLWRVKFPEISKVLDKESFYPRALYGMYLEERFNDATELLKGFGARIQPVEGEVISRRSIGATEYLEVTLNTTKQTVGIEANIVVVAIGNPPPKPIASLKDLPYYIHNVWSEEIQKVNAESAVVVVGLGLAAVDALRTLKENGHKGKITAISSSGELPISHQNDYRVYERVVFTDDAVRKLNPPTAKGFNDLLQKEIALAEQHHFSCRNVADSLRELNEKDRENSLKQSSFATYWKDLSIEEKIIWNNEYSSRFNKLLFRVAPASHKAIISLIETNQMTKTTGNSDDIIADKDTVYINCTGPDLLQNGFVKKLVDDGICQLHPAGGIKTNGELRLSGTSSKYHAIGPFFWGEKFETVPIYAITQQAQVLIKDIIKSLTLENANVK